MHALSLLQHPLVWLGELASALGHLWLPRVPSSTVEEIVPDDGSLVDSFPWHCCH
jgi:hypothetical protein